MGLVDSDREIPSIGRDYRYKLRAWAASVPVRLASLLVAVRWFAVVLDTSPLLPSRRWLNTPAPLCVLPLLAFHALPDVLADGAPLTELADHPSVLH